MNKKILIGIIVTLSTVLLASGTYFGVTKYIDYKNTKNVEDINALVEKEQSREVCEKILDFDIDDARGNNKFKREKYNLYHIKCNKEYNFKFIEQNLKNCENIIKGNKSDYKKDYIILEDFGEIQQRCSEKYLKITFGTGSFFDVNNNFKSRINLEFSMPFFTDSGKLASEEFITNRVEAKKRLISLLDISPKVNINIDDVVLYPKKAIINLALKPLTEYKMSLKSFSQDGSNLETQKKVFSFSTPENKFLGIQLKNPVSLYMDNKAPEFEIIKYNLPNKKKTTLKICRIDNENYAKIEILRGRKEAREQMRKFFLEGIDKLDTYKCFRKVVTLTSPHLTSPLEERDSKKIIPPTPTKGEGARGGGLLFRQKINLSQELGNPARSGLYFVTFDDKEDRNVNNNLQFPIFFGIIDSHITMKISKNGEGYFFVNDFEGNPLEGQEIRIYINKFVDHTSKYNRVLKKQEYTYNSPLEKSVLGKEILLGKTRPDGTLRVNLKDSVEGAFEKTFSADWNYKYSGVNESFFVTSASETNLTYNHSHWNAGIAPWNFGYKINSGWYGNESQDQSTPILSSWGREIKEFYSHTYTDRVLYLPGEEVNIKAILRKSTDLSIPQNKEFRIIVQDSKQKEILNSRLKLSDFGSISEKLKLNKDAPLGSYLVIVKDKNGEYSRTSFSVEVFKKPKFKNDVSLEVSGLNGEDVAVKKSDKKTKWGEKIYSGKFSIKARVESKYYNGGIPKQAQYNYKVYKQYYYDNGYWDNCYWGCFWEPEKVFYSQGKGNLDEHGKANFNIDVAFESSYDDYKYIVEVSVTDSLGDTISGANSIIARLPENLKTWNQKADLKFSTSNKFYKKDLSFTVTGGLSRGKWIPEYDNKYLFVIKKKNYITKYIDDVRGYKRPVNVVEEKLEKIMFVNSSNFRVTEDGKLELDFIPKESGEYVFEYGKINSALLNLPNKQDNKKQLKEFIKKFNTTKKLSLKLGTQKYYAGEENYEILNFLTQTCTDSKQKCKRKYIEEKLFCKKRNYISGEVKIIDNCSSKNTLEIAQKIGISDIFDQEKKYVSILSYGDINAKNPIASDNKVRVLSEKVSYHLGETAKILIRLPFNKGKILWTIEKQGVIKKEYIDVNSNMFFKEVLVDDSFVPNAYIGIVAIEVDGEKVPEYKVGYTEIVVDKTDKKSFVKITSDKKKYKPRETVTLNISNKINQTKNNGIKLKAGKKAELTVMVVDDSLISLMGNVDLNTLEKFYKKLPFQIQTSLTNLAMLKNYYFSRPGIVGGSGFGNFKGGDSAVSSRTIFKNTAYYNPSVITDENGNAKVEFELPDNLTNFRIMVVANSKDNFFGFASENIQVRKSVAIEDKTPLIYRYGDKTEIGAQIFNNTDKEIGFNVQFSSKDIQMNKAEKFVVVGAQSSQVVQFWTQGSIDKDSDISYSISALGDSAENSDKLEKTIENKQFPALKSVFVKGGLALPQQKQSFNIPVPENADLEKSKVTISFSNNVLQGVQKTLKSLLIYPYGCIEQTMSSTYPNAILLSFGDIFPDTLSTQKAKSNLRSGIERIASMQLESGGFGYWQGDNQANLHITPYILRRLIDMKKFGGDVPDSMIKKARDYLEKNFKNITDSIDRTETFYTFSKIGKAEQAYNVLLKDVDKLTFTRHEWIVYTYGLIEWDRVGNKEVIDRNIKRITVKLGDKSQSYWSARSDKALFTGMLIDYNYNKKIIDKYIQELYKVDWSSYYYSTTAKNNAFIAFAKYIKKYAKNSQSNFAFSAGVIHNRDQRFNLGGEYANTFTREFRLKDIIKYKEDKIELTTYILSGKSIFTNLTLEIIPKDKLKIKKVSNGIQVERKIYEVLDINKIEDCSAVYYWREQKTNCSGVLREITDGKYKKGEFYKIGIKVSFTKDGGHKNVALEDYLPSTFKIINSKFKTESSASKKGNKKSWSWNHVEYLKDRIFANATNAWNDDLYFEYIVKPEFEGEFVYPPVSAYMMYDGDIRAHSKFSKIIVK